MNVHSLEADFCVIGGGMAGVCAALAAARNGARVILVQDRSVLGGNASSEVRMHIVGADCHGNRPGARETGLIEEFRLEDSFRNPHRSFSLWDLLLYEKVTENKNITLLLDSDCIGCETEVRDGVTRIASVRVLRHFTEDEFVIRASFFADCSGDGRLGSEAGADFRIGRESRDEYGESMALPRADSFTLGSSILFTARRHETPQPFVRPPWIRQFRREDFRFRPITGFEYGYWWAEWGGHLDMIKDGESVRHELLRIALGIWDYVKNSGEHPDSSHWALDWVGAIPAKRESRRFLGDYVLTQGDVQSGRIFPDQVAYGGWWIDIHPPQGVDAIDEKPCVQEHISSLYTIPLRALYSRNIANLFFAGRNISATHVAFASTRVMATCAVMGQAIGTAAALLSGRDALSIRSACDDAMLSAIQQTLLRQDAFLPGLANADSGDLARRAVCRASSALDTALASNVVSGITRTLDQSWNTWSPPSSHVWESVSLPAWMELSWPEPVSLSRIEITFCSGLQRELILSPSDHASRKSIRGPQPETVCDYDILLDGRPVLSIRGNYLRKRVHILPAPCAVHAMSIHVLATHGHPSARIFEIRAYGQ